MKPWYELIRPKQDIVDGTGLDIGAFAVQLDLVAKGDTATPAIYLDPEQFYANTVLTAGMVEITKQVKDRLSGKAGEGSVINLNTSFGGGKTHTLVHLYHLFNAGEDARPWIRSGTLDDLDSRIGSDPIPTARVITWVGTDYSPQRADSNGFRMPWTQLLGQLGTEAVEKLKDFDSAEHRPDKTTIREILDVGEPVLILLDEIINATEAMRGISVGQSTLSNMYRQFYQNLSEVASQGSVPVFIVNSFSKSTGNITEADQEDIDLFSNVAGRVDYGMQVAQGSEIADIIRKRLFEPVDDKSNLKQINKTIDIWLEWMTENHDHLAVDVPIGDMRRSFVSSYPFHPRVLSVFEHKWQGLSSFQRTRGVLRMLALWLTRVFQDDHLNASKNSLIMLGHAPVGNSTFADVMYRQMGDADLSVPIIADVAGGDSHANRLDEQNSGPIRINRLHRQTGTVVFIESAGGVKVQHATTGEVKFAVCGPDAAEPSDVDTCLIGLDKQGYYFRSQQDAHRITKRANLNKLVLTERASVEEADVVRLIDQIVEEELGRPSLLSVRFGTRYAEDLPDSPQFQLAVLPSDIPAGAGENCSDGVVQSILNGGTRTYKRLVAFLSLGSDRGRLMKHAREHLTYKAIQKKRDLYQLEDGDRQSLPGKIRDALEELRDEVWRSYTILHLGEKDGTLTRTSLGLLNRSMSTSGLAHVISEQLRSTDTLAVRVGRRVLEKWPEAFLNEGVRRPWPLASVRDNVLQSKKVFRGRLAKLDGLKDSVAKWVAEGYAVLVNINDDGSFSSILCNSGTPESRVKPEVVFDLETGILRPEDLPNAEGDDANDDDKDESEPGGEEVKEQLTEPSDEPSKATDEAPLPTEPVEWQTRFSVPLRKITNLQTVWMELAMALEHADAFVEVKGKLRSGSDDPSESIRRKIEGAEGAIDE